MLISKFEYVEKVAKNVKKVINDKWKMDFWLIYYCVQKFSAYNLLG